MSRRDAGEALAGLGVAVAAVLEDAELVAGAAVEDELVVGAGVEVVVGSQHSTTATDGTHAST